MAVYCCLPSFAQENKLPMLSWELWLTGEGLGIVEIYKNGNKLQGKIVWLKEPNDPKTVNQNRHQSSRQGAT